MTLNKFNMAEPIMKLLGQNLNIAFVFIFYLQVLKNLLVFLGHEHSNYEIWQMDKCNQNFCCRFAQKC